MLKGFVSRLLARRRARRLAAEAGRQMRPGEPIHGTWLCADEADRYVVRVFCGKHTSERPMKALPPWRECLIFGVDKQREVAELVTNDEPYRPVLR